MRALAVVALLAALPGGTVMGQWHVGLELGSTRYSGSAHDTSSSTGPPTFRPGAAPMIGLRVERIMGRFGAALRVSYAKPGLAAGGNDLTVVDKSSGELIEVATLVAVRVGGGGIGPSGAIRAELGPALHLWKFGDDLRSRIGALGAVAYEWPVAGRLSGAIRLEGALSRSWFEEGDLPPEYELRPTWRYGVTLGLRYRL
jgi:hypothetical protein